MKVDLISDVHLECGGLTLPGGDILVLAGDACEATNLFNGFHKTRLLDGNSPDRFLHFFERECKKYSKVLYVLGNHEHYHGVFTDSKDMLEKSVPDNVFVMEKETYDAGDVVFVATTLWTNLHKRDPQTMWHVQQNMNDYHVIRYDDYHGRKLLPDDTVDEHDAAVQWLTDTIDRVPEKQVFVITHHAPTSMSVDARYKHDSLMNGGYYSDLSNFILDRPQIKHWVHGHMHLPANYMVGACEVTANPRGYAPFEADPKYQPKTIIK